MNSLFADSKHVTSSTFAICMADHGGQITVGGPNTSYHDGSVVWIPLQRTKRLFSVAVSSVSMGGRVITGRSNAMIDSGTTFTYMGSVEYRAMKNAIESYCDQNQHCGATQQGNKCYTVSNINLFPELSVQFGAVSTPWPPRAYMVRKGYTKTWCYGFADDGVGAEMTLGNTWMMHKEVIFDTVNYKVGVVKANCPVYKTRPSHIKDADMTVPGEEATTPKQSTTRSSWGFITSTQEPTTTEGFQKSSRERASQDMIWVRDPANIPLIAAALTAWSCLLCFLSLVLLMVYRRHRETKHFQLREDDTCCGSFGGPPNIVGDAEAAQEETRQ